MGGSTFATVLPSSHVIAPNSVPNLSRAVKRQELNRPGELPQSRRAVPVSCNLNGGGAGGRGGEYPWWQAERDPSELHGDREVITIFTSEGIVRLPGRRLKGPTPKRPTKQWRLEDYLAPQTAGLCKASTFAICATNGIDFARKLSFVGFCPSVELLSEVVRDTVLWEGGEVLAADKQADSSLNEKLWMSVVLPALWGVPPTAEHLHHAITTGGGLVDKISKQWLFYPS
eukprot:jgi/Mesvir1/12062/Mv00348-RA.1